MRCNFPPCKLWLLALFATPVAHSQDILWEKSYGGKHSDYLFDVQPTADYGFILAGSSLSRKTGTKTEDNRGDLDYWIWKMDEDGNPDWQKTFGGNGMDLLQAIALTADGGFILGGSSDSPKSGDKKDDSFGQQDYWVAKLNAKGAEQWQRTIGGEGQDILVTVLQTRDGGYLLAGSSASDNNIKDTSGDFFGKTQNSFGNLDYWVVRLDSKGKILWQQTFGGQYADELRSAEATKDGGFILGGYSNSPESGTKSERNFGKGDYWVIKLDKDGQQEWQKVLGGEDDEQLRVIRQTYDGNYIVAGSSNSGNTGNKTKGNRNGTDFWLVKLDGKGDILWEETYDAGKTDLLTSLMENDDHTLLLGGYAQSETLGMKKQDKEGINDYVAIKLLETGEEQWSKTVGSAGEDVLRKVIETRDGGYLMAGTSDSGVSKDKNTNIGRNDFWVVKLKDKTKKEKQKANIEAFPNPTDSFTNVIVGYDFDKGTVTLVDLAGHVLQQFEAAGRTIPVDLSRYPEGIYIVNLKTDKGSSDGIKIIKMKN